MSKKPPTPQRTQAQLLDALKYAVLAEMERFPVLVWWQHYSPKIAPHVHPEALNRFRVACMDATLLVVRKFDDCFSPKHVYPDDLRATEYGFIARGRVIARKRRKTICSHIAHIGWTGKKRVRVVVHSSAKPALRQCVRFLKSLEGQRFAASRPTLEKHITRLRNDMELALADPAWGKRRVPIKSPGGQQPNA